MNAAAFLPVAPPCGWYGAGELTGIRQTYWNAASG
jgi:hypothetical protein